MASLVPSLLAAATLGLGVLGLARIRNPYLTAAYFGHLLAFAYIQNFPSGRDAAVRDAGVLPARPRGALCEAARGAQARSFSAGLTAAFSPEGRAALRPRP